MKNNLIKYILVLVPSLVIFFFVIYKTELVYKNANISERVLFETLNYSDCSEVDMKWVGSNTYISGLFFELNGLTETKNLKKLLPKRDEIKILKIESLNLKELPQELFLFSNLKALDISNNPFENLEQLIDDLTKFPKLELLAMRHCGIEELPDNIYLLDNLVGLSLGQNISMTEVNKNLGKLKNLRYLSFRRNKKLKDLPETIGDLKCLEQIDLSGAGFIRIREELTYCTTLKNITANASKIEDLPIGLGRLKDLKHLNLGANKIEILPESIGKLEQLEYLSIGSNEIKKLPEPISGLRKLKTFSLDFNRFKEFPNEILKLKNLRNLYLHNNSFQDVPIEVANLPQLKQLYVDHEVISDVNIELLRGENPNLKLKKHDGLRLVKGPRRKK